MSLGAGFTRGCILFNVYKHRLNGDRHLPQVEKDCYKISFIADKIIKEIQLEAQEPQTVRL